MRHRHITLWLAPALLLCCAAACSDSDEESLPSFISDYACLTAQRDGTPYILTTDAGERLRIANGEQFRRQPNWKSDTLYRVVCRYWPTQEEDGKRVQLYSLAQAIAPLPITLDEGDTLVQHPVEVVSIWRSGRYVNFILSVAALDGAHRLAFVDLTPGEQTAPVRRIALLHDRMNDVEGYDQRAYCSLPLDGWRQPLAAGDSLTLSIVTGEGEKIFGFRY